MTTEKYDFKAKMSQIISLSIKYHKDADKDYKKEIEKFGKLLIEVVKESLDKISNSEFIEEYYDSYYDNVKEKKIKFGIVTYRPCDNTIIIELDIDIDKNNHEEVYKRYKKFQEKDKVLNNLHKYIRKEMAQKYDLTSFSLYNSAGYNEAPDLSISVEIPIDQSLYDDCKKYLVDTKQF